MMAEDLFTFCRITISTDCIKQLSDIFQTDPLLNAFNVLQKQ